MGTGRTEEFRKNAVRIALTLRLSRQHVADDFDVGNRIMRIAAGYSDGNDAVELSNVRYSRSPSSAIHRRVRRCARSPRSHRSRTCPRRVI